MKTSSLQIASFASACVQGLRSIAWPLLVLGSGLALVSPCAGAPFTFEVTGSLATARVSHTATLLPNGKVLVAGGLAGTGALSSAELFDPATGNWTATGSLATARQDHTATLLPNGKVLVAGGFDSTRSFSSSAELYDPATGSWTATGSLVDPRENHTATLLPNGKVLVAGGDGDNGTTSYFSRGELYDPAAGTWTTTGSLATPRAFHTATLLPNGKVLVAAGRTSYGTLATAELYDPATESWTETGSLASERFHDAATLLPNGKVLVTGGVDFTYTALASAELYDPATGSWTATGSLNAARGYHTAALLPDGQVMLAGGFDKTSAALTSAELFDPASGSWTTMGNMTTARGAHTESLLPNGKVLVLGGSDGVGELLASAELYDSADGNWTPTGNLSVERLGHTATLLPNGKVLVAGGYVVDSAEDPFPYSSAELYDPAIGTWSAADPMATRRYQYTATLLPNGKVLVAGGVGLGSAILTSAELYDPVKGSWTATGSMTTARAGDTATLLPNGKVLAAGGYDRTGVLASAELYDPASGSWAATGSMATARISHTTTLLPNGKVLVAGGSDGTSILASVELYDPVSGSWVAAGSMTTARDSPTASLLPNGQVLVAGGFDDTTYLASAELYDPTTGSWTITGRMTGARAGHTATLLPGGQVLVAGGSGDQNSVSTSELYDPPTRNWATTGSLATERFNHTATLLWTGNVLAVGGISRTSVLSSAELYDVGLGFQSEWQPQIASALLSDTVLDLTGTLFQGVSQASGGNTQDSSTNYPLVQLRSLANEQVAFLPVDPVLGWSDTAFTSEPVSGFPFGPALVTVFANGIPSASRYVVLVEPTELGNSSTRLAVGLGDDVGIAGFIIRGTVPRLVLVRALGPSLNVGGVPLPGRLENPMVELFDAQQQLVAQNDNWQSDQEAAIAATGLAPTDPQEAAILMELEPGAYTAVISGTGKTTGIALIEAYSLPGAAGADLGNISTRGLVQTGDEVLIGGVILSGGSPAQLLFRAIGPELTDLGVAGALQDTTIDLYDSNGVLLEFNDNWQDTQGAQITATGLAPTDPRESAILATLMSGGYTAIVRGKDAATGVALVEAYHLLDPPAAVAR